MRGDQINLTESTLHLWDTANRIPEWDEEMAVHEEPWDSDGSMEMPSHWGIQKQRVEQAHLDKWQPMRADVQGHTHLHHSSYKVAQLKVIQGKKVEEYVRSLALALQSREGRKKERERWNYLMNKSLHWNSMDYQPIIEENSDPRNILVRRAQTVVYLATSIREAWKHDKEESLRSLEKTRWEMATLRKTLQKSRLERDLDSQLLQDLQVNMQTLESKNLELRSKLRKLANKERKRGKGSSMASQQSGAEDLVMDLVEDMEDLDTELEGSSQANLVAASLQEHLNTRAKSIALDRQETLQLDSQELGHESADAQAKTGNLTPERAGNLSPTWSVQTGSPWEILGLDPKKRKIGSPQVDKTGSQISSPKVAGTLGDDGSLDLTGTQGGQEPPTSPPPLPPAAVHQPTRSPLSRPLFSTGSWGIKPPPTSQAKELEQPDQGQQSNPTEPVGLQAPSSPDQAPGSHIPMPEPVEPGPQASADWKQAVMDLTQRINTQQATMETLKAGLPPPAEKQGQPQPRQQLGETRDEWGKPPPARQPTWQPAQGNVDRGRPSNRAQAPSGTYRAQSADTREPPLNRQLQFGTAPPVPPAPGMQGTKRLRTQSATQPAREGGGARGRGMQRGRGRGNRTWRPATRPQETQASIPTTTQQPQR